jgi:general stress protein 26
MVKGIEMDEQIIRHACLQLIQKTESVYVSTINELGYPQTRVMSNLKNSKLFERLIDFFSLQINEFVIYLNTNHCSDKMKHIANNPKTCLYYCDFQETHGIALTGDMEVIEDNNIRKTLWQDDWIQFYDGGLYGTDYTILRIIPVSAKGWYKTRKFEFMI